MKKHYTIVKSQQELELLQKHIDEHEYLAFDTETTGLNVRKDKVIGLSVSGEVGTAFYLPLLSWDKHLHCLRPVFASEADFRSILIKLEQKELLTWNGSFDVRVVKSNFGIDLAPALLADVMLMKHTVEEEGRFGLKEVAIQLAAELGLGDAETAANEEQLALKANVLANGGTWLKSNKEMYKADLDVMGPYACADADLTLRIAEHYRQKLEEEGLEEFFFDKEVMPLYKSVTITMEEKGVHLDLEKIHATRAAILKDMEQLEQKILSQLEALPEVGEWKLQRALEEFEPKPTGAFAQMVCKYYNLDLPKTKSGKFSLTEKFLDAHRPCNAADFLMERATLPEAHVQDIAWMLFCDKGLNTINISSKQQMGQIVFDCLGIRPLSKTDKGAPQFDDDMIQHLADVEELSWAKDLSNYNKLVKILGTYIDRFLDAQEDGYYYFSYKQHGTISGRFSGDAQQLPRPKEDGELDEIVLKYVNIVRSFFIAEEGRVFIDCDYESLEPHVFSHVSGDERLRDIFRKGHDFYSTIAIRTEKLDQYSADKKAENYLGKKAKPKRQSAKAYSLGIPYGLKEFALGKTLNVSTEEAKGLIEGYLSGFPDLANWMEESERFVKLNGYIKTESGRIRHLPKVKELYKKHGDQLLNFKYRMQLQRKSPKELVMGWYRDYKNGLNNAKNVQIQGLSASIINIAMIEINKQFKAAGIDGYVCATIHDQAIMNVPEDKVEECKAIIEKAMTTTTKLSVDLKAPPAVAHNWKDGH